MRFLVDTNLLIALLRGDRHVLARLRQHRPTEFGLSAIVSHELFYGAWRSRDVEANLRRIEELRFQPVPFEQEDARAAGEIRAELAASGNPIGPYDALIAGQAVARDLVLITHNLREFRRVGRLRVEDWAG